MPGAPADGPDRERTLFTLDWIIDEDLRKTTTAELNRGESRNSLLCVVNLHRVGRFRDRSSYWKAIYTGRVDVLRNAGHAVPEHLLSSLSHSHGSM